MSTTTTVSIDLHDDQFWNEQISKVDQLHVEITELLGKTQRDSSNRSILKELTLTLELLGAVRLAWDMTEPGSGEVAAITAEPVDDEERIELRIRINGALATAQASIDSARAALT